MQVNNSSDIPSLSKEISEKTKTPGQDLASKINSFSEGILQEGDNDFQEIDLEPPPLQDKIISTNTTKLNFLAKIIQSCSLLATQALSFLASCLPQSSRVPTKDAMQKKDPTEVSRKETQTSRSKELENINKVMQEAVQKNELQFIAKGAAKMVWKAEVFNPQNAEKKYVVYTPKPDWFGSKEAEIKKELSTAADIRKNIKQFNLEHPENPVSTDSLSIDLEVLEGAKKKSVFGHTFAVRTEEASTDLSHIIKNPSLSFEERLNLGRDILNGANTLQRAGFLHGDIKPDNFLIVNGTAKLADWGKTRRIEDVGMRQGNRAYAAPEYQDSPKAEVYSIGLVLIRTLEESVLLNRSSSSANLEELSTKELDIEAKTGKDLEAIPLLQVEDPNMVISPESTKTHGNSSKLSGIEKFMTQNKYTYQKDQGLIGRVTTVSYYMSGRTDKASLQSAEKETHKYIESLMNILQNDPKNLELDSKDFKDLETLLKDMTKSDPNQRPSMSEALKRYNAILGEALALK